MTTPARLVAAKTHSSEYLLHKYWSRKPHNVISHFLSSLVPYDGTVVDPFCGSGVTLREASLLGLTAYGFDVNPVANLISSVTTNPPSTKEFYETIEPILDSLEKKFKHLYTTQDGQIIRYNVHEMIVTCKNCFSKVPHRSAAGKGRSYSCPKCGGKLNFNLENLTDTDVTSISISTKHINEHKLDLDKQKELSNFHFSDNLENYDQLFVENRRILSFAGLSTSKLFTKRNFSLLCEVATEFEKIQDETIRNAASMLLTASVAQCSRLIPYRNNMTTGGPAWSVPGFWVPAKHLETNPFLHLRARLVKFERGLNTLASNPGKATTQVQKKSAVQGLKELRENEIFADLIFFDPPYGDSVPYLEFSSMWNSFLGKLPDPALDISVSDRLSKNTSWRNYALDLRENISEIALTLKPTGSLLITFNNHEIKAWESLFTALQLNNLECNYVSYQIPAVISSKAQFSLEGSYISDIYSVYKLNPDFIPTRSLEPLVEALHNCASSRGGTISKNLAFRIATVAWMQNNIAVDLLHERDTLIQNLFEIREDKLVWKGTLNKAIPSIATLVQEITYQKLSDGPCEWIELYETIAEAVVDVGVPNPDELKNILNEFVIFEKTRCLAVNKLDDENEVQIEFSFEL